MTKTHWRILVFDPNEQPIHLTHKTNVMKTAVNRFKKCLGVLAITTISLCTSAQQTTVVRQSVAVSNPHVEGIDISPESVAKMIRLELTKIQEYVVFDEFDMKDVTNDDASFKECLGKKCLIRMGKTLGVDHMITGSYDLLGNKIVISLKTVEVNNPENYQAVVREFDDQPYELARMTQIVLKEILGMEQNENLVKQLDFKDEPITSTNVGRIKNNGPRIGLAALTGDLMEFAKRSEGQGGLDIVPFVSMIGYQLEARYVGTENFSALVEGIINVSGLEQGSFIPSITLMHGFRFGKGGWEFAFGPGFGVKRTSRGFFDVEGVFGETGKYFSESDWETYARENLSGDPQFNTTGQFVAPAPSFFQSRYNFGRKYMDNRGKYELNTTFVFAFGRTFRAGALNIPVNVFYSAQKRSAIVGLNVGFNVIREKRRINP